MAPVLQSRTCFCFETYTGGHNSAEWPSQPRQIIRTLPLEASRRMVDRGPWGWCLQLDSSFVSSLGAQWCIVHRSSLPSASKPLQLVCGWQLSITPLKVRSDLKRVVLLQRGGGQGAIDRNQGAPFFAVFVCEQGQTCTMKGPYQIW